MDANRIVVGYVKTPEGEAALERAITEARTHDAELIVVHSAKGRAADDPEQVHAYREALEEIDRRLTEEGIPHRMRDYVRGQTPAEDLSQTVEEEGADLLVIGLRHREVPAGERRPGHPPLGPLSGDGGEGLGLSLLRGSAAAG